MHDLIMFDWSSVSPDQPILDGKLGFNYKEEANLNSVLLISEIMALQGRVSKYVYIFVCMLDIHFLLFVYMLDIHFFKIVFETLRRPWHETFCNVRFCVRFFPRHFPIIRMVLIYLRHLSPQAQVQGEEPSAEENQSASTIIAEEQRARIAEELSKYKVHTLKNFAVCYFIKKMSKFCNCAGSRSEGSRARALSGSLGSRAQVAWSAPTLPLRPGPCASDSDGRKAGGESAVVPASACMVVRRLHGRG